MHKMTNGKKGKVQIFKLIVIIVTQLKKVVSVLERAIRWAGCGPAIKLTDKTHCFCLMEKNLWVAT